jgi:hypothetical protein
MKSQFSGQIDIYLVGGREFTVQCPMLKFMFTKKLQDAHPTKNWGVEKDEHRIESSPRTSYYVK